MINLPIFRAKKLGTENEYVEGFLYQDLICYIPSDGFKPDEYKKAVDTETWFIVDNLSNTSMIDISTLSIHFPNMLDSQDNKIFASLQEDGKGGDIMQDDEYFGIAKYKDCQFVVEYEDCIDNIDNGNFEVIGIQQ